MPKSTRYFTAVLYLAFSVSPPPPLWQFGGYAQNNATNGALEGQLGGDFRLGRGTLSLDAIYNLNAVALSLAGAPGAGTLTEVEMVATLPAHFRGEANAADIHVRPDGRFLYASERQTSTLAGFRVDPTNALLSPIGRWPTETTPRGFAIDPRGRFLLAAGLDSNRLSVHVIEPRC
jgi:Lactonase, 7-bladed beta-propeller